MKIKTDYNGNPNITAGAEYVVLTRHSDDMMTIRDDAMELIIVHIPRCAHIDYNHWTIVNQEDIHRDTL